MNQTKRDLDSMAEWQKFQKTLGAILKRKLTASARATVQRGITRV